MTGAITAGVLTMSIASVTIIMTIAVRVPDHDFTRELLALGEAYPDLKASANFQQLQVDLGNVEDKLAAARRFFNNAVGEFNAAIQAFPAVLFAPQMGFTQREFFDVGPETRAQIEVAPSVKF